MERKTRSNKKIMKLLLAAAVLALMLGVTSFAAGDVYVDMQPTNGVYAYSGIWEDNSTNVYHRISVGSSGALAVTGTSVSDYGTLGYVSVELYSSNMKRLDNSNYATMVNADQTKVAVYGVKKGTYFIKTTGQKRYVLSAAFKKATAKSGTSKKKAVTLKQNKTIRATVPAGESSKATDWYKFNVTKSRKLELTIDTANNGYFEFYLYGPSYKNGVRIGSLKNNGGTYYSINLLSGKKAKVKTGTYYIRVKRSSYDKKASGIYTIKWRLR